ncbi:MAG TPA: histidine kinase, partial [Longimicrobiaceae bacterium]|nr:histidine kinase [Longimicrobiaceae bacterium]
MPVRALLRVPLFWKILIANAVLVLLGAVLGGTLTASYGVPVVALVGVAVTLLVNAAILRLALKPLELLERTAERVRSGDLDARAPHSPVADRDLEHLTRTFNGMLDAGAAARERLRELAARALTAAEEERKRIARELHDETAQRLAALLVRTRAARNAAADPERLDALLDDLRRDLGEALEGVRRFARGLRPPALDELGLVPAIESHLRHVAETSGLEVTLDAAPVGGALSPEAELAVYRIVQEALANVVRHAGARRAAVRLAREAGHLVVSVEDDGKGFSPRGGGGGLGLFGMSERAGYLGGRVEVRSA